MKEGEKISYDEWVETYGFNPFPNIKTVLPQMFVGNECPTVGFVGARYDLAADSSSLAAEAQPH